MKRFFFCVYTVKYCHLFLTHLKWEFSEVKQVGEWRRWGKSSHFHYTWPMRWCSYGNLKRKSLIGKGNSRFDTIFTSHHTKVRAINFSINISFFSISFHFIGAARLLKTTPLRRSHTSSRFSSMTFPTFYTFPHPIIRIQNVELEKGKKKIHFQAIKQYKISPLLHTDHKVLHSSKRSKKQQKKIKILWK